MFVIGAEEVFVVFKTRPRVIITGGDGDIRYHPRSGSIDDGDGDGDEDAMFIRSFWFSTNGGGSPSSSLFSTNGGGDGDGGEDGLSVLVLNERRREAR